MPNSIKLLDYYILSNAPPKKRQQALKMAESFENWDNIIRDLAKNKVQKSLAEALNGFEKQEEER